MRMLRGCRASWGLTVQLATRLPDRLADGLLRYSAARLSVCRVVLQSPLARHARLVSDKSLASSKRPLSDTSDTPDFLVAC